MSELDQGPSNAGVAGALKELDSGREAYARRAWVDAYRWLSLADVATPLGLEDLERLALSAYLIGRESEYLRTLDRAHRAYLDDDEPVRAARCAFWMGLSLLFQGEVGPASGWFGRARRLLEHHGGNCVEQGYLLIPQAEQQLVAADCQAAFATSAEAASIGEGFEDPDLTACARHLQGRALIQQGRVEQGLALLDEAMVSVIADELSPLMTGLIYCSVIESCQQVYALGRARQWTSALAEWCAQQPQLVSYTGACLVRRAEIMLFHGAWPDAIEEVQRVCAGSPSGIEQAPPAAAFYQEGEVHRLRGEFEEAEESYRRASRRGFEPQPGLALLRLVQGHPDSAAATLRRTLATTTDSLQRTRLLPAHIEVMLAVGDLREARIACQELDEIADAYEVPVLYALAAHARGSVALAESDPSAALGPLRHAYDVWRRVEAPYQVARARELMGLACRALGDDEGAELELDAAKDEFRRLGALPDLARPAESIKGRPPEPAHRLTRRELQVLRLIAAGKTNKVIAAELSLSQRTIDRHVSNLFGKLEVESRSAATSYAHTHKLV